MVPKRILATLAIFCVFSSAALAELDNPSWSEFRNVETGRYMDVRNGDFRPGIRLWMWDGNTTDAQVFNPRPESDTDYHQVYIRPRFDRKTLWMTIIEVNVREIIVREGEPPPERYRVTIETEIEPPEETGGRFAVPTGALDGLPMVPQPIHQRWRFEPVEGRANQYSIRPAAFPDMALTANGSARGSKLVLRDYDDRDTQHWTVDELVIDEPRNVMLDDFKYFPIGKLLGDVTWQVNGSGIDYFRVTAFSSEFGEMRSEKLGSSTRSWDIDFEPGIEARDKEFCFRVEAVDERAGTNIETQSDQVCEVARRNAPQTTKYSKASIENCHPDRITVRIWTSANGGSWDDKGTLSHQYGSGGCPQTGSPKTFDFADDSFTEIVAIHSNCGNGNPSEVNASCRVLNTSQIPGDSSSANTFRFRLGVGQLP